MNTDHLSRGWALIAEGAEMISLAYASIEQPAAAAVPPTAPADYDDLPPDVEPARRAAAQTGTALSMCPLHGQAWTVKAGGISKNGNPYSAFWKCSERDAEGYCQAKPVKAWADSHPIQEEAVA